MKRIRSERHRQTDRDRQTERKTETERDRERNQQHPATPNLETFIKTVDVCM